MENPKKRSGMRLRAAVADDVAAIRTILNQGIEDRMSTLETDLRADADVRRWLSERESRHAVLVAEEGSRVVGWAALNPYSHRCAHRAVADLAIYVERDWRGKGVGRLLLTELERVAFDNDFHKIVLFALTVNTAGRRLYERQGFREVGIFREHGSLDGKPMDVLVMEKLLA